MNAAVLMSPDAYPELFSITDEKALPLRDSWRYYVDPDRLASGRVSDVLVDLRRLETAFPASGVGGGQATTMRSGLLAFMIDPADPLGLGPGGPRRRRGRARGGGRGRPGPPRDPRLEAAPGDPGAESEPRRVTGPGGRIGRGRRPAADDPGRGPGRDPGDRARRGRPRPGVLRDPPRRGRARHRAPPGGRGAGRPGAARGDGPVGGPRPALWPATPGGGGLRRGRGDRRSLAAARARGRRRPHRVGDRRRRSVHRRGPGPGRRRRRVDHAATPADPARCA